MRCENSLLKLCAGAMLTLVLLLGNAAGALATNGMQLIGIGPVIRSMGGAGSALPLDSFVISLNPAAMSKLPARVDFGVTYFSPDSDYKVNHWARLPNIGGTSASQDSEFPASFIPSLGAVYPVNDALTLGLNVFGSAGMGVDYDPGVYGFGLETEYSIMKIVPALSYRISDKLSVGAALNIDMASMSFEGGGGFKHHKDTQWGIGFQLGLYFEPIEPLSLSVAYISEQYFNRFSFGTPVGTDEYALNQPMQIIAGIGYRPLDNLRLALDVKWINWSGVVGLNQPKSRKNASGQLFNMHWDNQFVFAFGAEYDLIPDHLKLRAGYNYSPNPLRSGRAFENLAFPALVEHHITAGLGFSFIEGFWINLGGMYAPRTSISGSNLTQGLASYKTSLSEFSLDLGLSYVF